MRRIIINMNLGHSGSFFGIVASMEKRSYDKLDPK
jgi:hypothetical protein